MNSVPRRFRGSLAALLGPIRKPIPSEGPARADSPSMPLPSSEAPSSVQRGEGTREDSPRKDAKEPG
jgi:hypothetical protein